MLAALGGMAFSLVAGSWLTERTASSDAGVPLPTLSEKHASQKSSGVRMAPYSCRQSESLFFVSRVLQGPQLIKI